MSVCADGMTLDWVRTEMVSVNPLNIPPSGVRCAFIEFFFNWKISLGGLVGSAILFRIVEITANEFTVKTIGQLADKMSEENYLKSRRNPATINRNEIVKKIEQLFIRDLYLDDAVEEITPETIIVERE